ncbi:transglutaminase family protein [Runella sp. MFBS21]|uniref:transglutaminase family protein n=1 Tax=Runella sp. MFBS21 TaxID=3034018 RepID=UPI0023F93679|nr:transglutaminase family protein [Runella sp. MFBS21]MDF7816180.1 transglutaminase family protein [Runella sp. MFBS21]
MKLRGKSVFKYQVNENTPVLMLLRPRRQEGQSIIKEEFTTEPTFPFNEYTDDYGNQCQRAVFPVGPLTITTEVESLVEPHVQLQEPFPEFVPVEELPSETIIYLLPSRYCQSELPEINDLAQQIVAEVPIGYLQAEAIRNWVHQNIKYEYNTTDSSTTAVDITRQKVGVCRDFTHLSIALCRSLCLPARMTVGYLDKLKYMDLHAWFEVFLGGQWHTFDAVQPQTEGCRIVIGYGRDAADVAMVTQFGDSELLSLTVETAVIEEE